MQGIGGFCAAAAVLVPVPLPSQLNGVVKEDTFVSSNLLPPSLPPSALPLIIL